MVAASTAASAVLTTSRERTGTVTGDPSITNFQPAGDIKPSNVTQS
jgi:hypothetical protein